MHPWAAPLSAIEKGVIPVNGWLAIRRMLPPGHQSLFFTALGHQFIAEHSLVETFPVIFSRLQSDACLNMDRRADKHCLIKLACMVQAVILTTYYLSYNL